jgi:hypothetical protein
MGPKVLALGCVLAAAVAARAATGTTDAVAVRHPEGVVHGFLTLSTLAGETLADGDLIQTTRGNRVTSRLVFHFRDGSLHDETAVFTQGRAFRLLSDHLVQKGPSFPHPLDATVDATRGHAVVRYADDGKERVEDDHFDAAPGLANGLMPVLLKNFAKGAALPRLAMLVATPKPRTVGLEVQRAGEDAFTVGGSKRTATRYVVKIHIGGISGVIAPLVGKEPPDTSVWILEGEAPAFLKSEGPLFAGGPVWRIALDSPSWPKAAAESR